MNVIGPVIVAVHVNGNAPVIVIGPVDTVKPVLRLHRTVVPTDSDAATGADHDHGGVPVHVHGHDHGAVHDHGGRSRTDHGLDHGPQPMSRAA